MQLKRTRGQVVPLGVRARLSRNTTHRLNAEIARELEIHSTVRRLSALQPGSQRGIVEAALADWFQRNPLSKQQRAAAETLIGPDGARS